MSSSTSVAVVFRTLQAIHDLRSVAEGVSESTLKRVTAGMFIDGAEGRLRRAIFDDGCRLEGIESREMHLSLVLAATLPDDDHDAFVFATAFLLADRLQHGGGTDDLFWHWDAFNDHYRMSGAPARAAIMNGFRRAHEDMRVRLEDPPEGPDLCTEPFPEIVTMAQNLQSCDLRDWLLEALTRGVTRQISTWWETEAAHARLRAEAPVTRILRHIYEREGTWNPYEDTVFLPDTAPAPVLPFPLG